MHGAPDGVAEPPLPSGHEEALGSPTHEALSSLQAMAGEAGAGLRAPAGERYQPQAMPGPGSVVPQPQPSGSPQHPGSTPPSPSPPPPRHPGMTAAAAAQPQSQQQPNSQGGPLDRQQQQQPNSQSGPLDRQQQQQSGNNSGGSGQPNHHNVVMKERLRWTPELHASFVKAVNQLGGAAKAKPKEILDILRIPGLSLNHVKSHLQKYRLSEGVPNADDGTSSLALAQQLHSLGSLQKRPRLEDALGQAGGGGWGSMEGRVGGGGGWSALAAGGIASLGLPQLPPQQPLHIPPLPTGPGAGAAALAAAAALVAARPPSHDADGPTAPGGGQPSWRHRQPEAPAATVGGLEAVLEALGSVDWRVPAAPAATAAAGPPPSSGASRAGAGGTASQEQLLVMLSDVVKQSRLGGGAMQGLPAAAVPAGEGGGSGPAGLAQLQQGVAVLHQAVVQHLESAAALQLDLQKKLQWHIQVQREFEQQLLSHVEAIRHLAVNSLGPLLSQLAALSDLSAKVAASIGGAATGAQERKGSGASEAAGDGLGIDGGDAAAGTAAAAAAAEERTAAGGVQQYRVKHEAQQQEGEGWQGRGGHGEGPAAHPGSGSDKDDRAWASSSPDATLAAAAGKWERERAAKAPLPAATRAAIDAVVALATAANAATPGSFGALGPGSLGSQPGSFGSQVPSRHSSGGFLPPGQQPTVPDGAGSLQSWQRGGGSGGVVLQPHGRGASLSSLGLGALGSLGSLTPSLLGALDSSFGTSLLGQGMGPPGPTFPPPPSRPPW